MLLVLIGLGFVFIILSMIFVVNPPEAWIKKVFLRKPAQAVPGPRDKKD